MRHWMLRVLGIALFLAMAPAAVWAQEGLRDRDRTFQASRTIADDLRRARLRYGPFYLLSRIELSDIGYTEDFYLPTDDSSTGLAASVIAPQRLYFVPTRKTVFSVEAQPQYYFLNSDRNTRARDRVGLFTRADAQFLLNHFYFDFFGTRATELRSSTTEINRLATRKNETVGMSGEFRYSSRTSAEWSTSYVNSSYPTSRLQPEDIDVFLLDRREHNYRATLRHKTFPLTSLRVIGEVSNYAFPYTTYKDSRRTYAGVGFDYVNGPTVFRADVGPGRLDFKNRDQKDYRGVLGNATWSHKTGERLSTSAGYSRDVEFSIYENNLYYVADRAALQFSYSATRRLTLRAGTNVGRDRYDGATFIPGGQLVHRNDTISFTSVGWLYSWRRVQGGFDVGYYQRNSNIPLDDNNGIRLVLHLSLTP